MHAFEQMVAATCHTEVEVEEAGKKEEGKIRERLEMKRQKSAHL